MVALNADSVKQKVFAYKVLCFQLSVVSGQKVSRFEYRSYKKGNESRCWHSIEIKAFVVDD